MSVFLFVTCFVTGRMVNIVKIRDLYKWASTIIASRAFSSKVLSGVIGASDLPEDRMSVLLPLIDVTNHRPLAKVEWKAGERDIGVTVLESVAAGQEVGNNYGPRNNEQCEFVSDSLG